MVLPGFWAKYIKFRVILVENLVFEVYKIYLVEFGTVFVLQDTEGVGENAPPPRKTVNYKMIYIHSYYSQWPG